MNSCLINWVANFLLIKYPALTKIRAEYSGLWEIADYALIPVITVAENDRQSKIIYKKNICRDQPWLKKQVI